jgi:hypothetical protein
MRFILAVAFMGFSIWALWLTRRKEMRWAFATLFIGVLVWFGSIHPSHDRRWREEVRVLPRAVIDGDHVRLTNVRDFEYRSRNDFTARYVDREVLLSHLTSVDFFVSYWKPGVIAHTFLSFDFDNADPICVSIEIRPEEGESFRAIPALFKQFELIYVVGSERDLVGVRATHRNEEVYLYPIRVSAEAARRLFVVYLDRINDLADKPEFYNLLSNNCTINIARYARVAGQKNRFDIRYLVNGLIDRYIYGAHLVDTSIPFEELRERCRITDAARAADKAPDFSKRIRGSF